MKKEIKRTQEVKEKGVKREKEKESEKEPRAIGRSGLRCVFLFLLAFQHLHDGQEIGEGFSGAFGMMRERKKKRGREEEEIIRVRERERKRGG